MDEDDLLVGRIHQLEEELKMAYEEIDALRSCLMEDEGISELNSHLAVSMQIIEEDEL